jgi:hypothetical protein
VVGEDPVLVVSEAGEAVDVLPYLLVGRVEEVSAIPVHLDPGFRLGLGVGVAADVVAPFQHQYPLAQPRGGALGDSEPEKARADHDQVMSRVRHGA